MNALYMYVCFLPLKVQPEVMFLHKCFKGCNFDLLKGLILYMYKWEMPWVEAG